MSLTTRQLFLQSLAQTSSQPLALEVVSANGLELLGSNGEKWLDLISGISVSSVGHSNPDVLSAIHDQASKFMHLMVYGELALSPQVNFANALLDLLPASLNNCYFVNSGSEAIEGAMKLAKRFTGRSDMVAFNDAYHGSTQGALSIIGSEYFRRSFRPLLPGVTHIDFDDEQQLGLINSQTACVVMEMVRGEAGAVVPTAGFVKKVHDRCKHVGALFVVDEIQSGFYRTGPFMAFMDEGVEPDILVIGKAMGGGMPLGAFIASNKIMSSLMDHPVLGHITTFGGHPVCCAAGSASLNVLSKIGTDRIAYLGQLFKSKLVHPQIKSVSGKGLLLGVDLGTEVFNRSVVNECISRGVLTDWFLFAPHKLRIAPPLIISEEQVDWACDVILESIDVVSSKSQLP
ncbi:MAG: aspartate aminotransferase family protein [Bacteroidota bacterium]